MHFGPEPQWLRAVFNGSLGVSTFFAISGFIISYLLLEERRKYGQISVARFYMRRAFRILPPLYVYLVAMAFLFWMEKTPGRWMDFFTTLGLVSNYIVGLKTWVLGHLWSLSVEEQFYLFWPWIVAVLKPRQLIYFSVLGVAFSPLIRASQGGVHWMHGAVQPFALNPGDLFHNRLDAFLWGALGAHAYQARQELTRIWVGARGVLPTLATVLFGVLVLVLPLAKYFLHWNLDHPIFFSFQSATLGLLIFTAVLCPESLLGRLCNLRWVVGLGWISYSLYLWQQPMIGRCGLPESEMYFWERTPLNLILAIAIALCSYRWIEEPARRLRRRLVADWVPRTPKP